MIETTIFAICFIGFAMAFLNYRKVIAQSAGNKKMQEIAGYIAEGAKSFLKAEYKIMAIFVVVVATLIYLFLDISTTYYNEGFFTAIAFIVGSVASIASGAIGMYVATKANVRTTEASRKSISQGFDVAFRGGSVLGLALVSFAVFGIMLLFVLYNMTGMETHTLVEVLTGYGLGGSMMALFGRVGGGIYTKAADIGADLVGKVEKGIPEDDPRNPAVIADNVGDNVGDIAGMGSDLFGSVAESTCAALVIGAIAFGSNIKALTFPILVSAVGILASIVVLFFVKVKKGSKDVEWPIKNALIGSTVLMGFLLVFITPWALPATFTLAGQTYTSNGVLYALLSGLIAGLLIGLITEYYTSASFKPVRQNAESAKTGAATLIIDGLALGYESAVLPVLLLAFTAVLGFQFAGFYGIALAALGMLGTLVVGLTIDVYGPISDNAGGIAEMSGLDKKVRERTDVLDAAGNTTAAIGKGFAIGSATLTALALFGAFVTAANVSSVNLLDIKVMAGVMVGGMLPFLFSSMTMKSVGKAAQAIIVEVRRQFKTTKGLMSGKVKPDYDKCISISTEASLREMIAPGILIMATPVVVGLAFGVEVLAGVLAGSIASGVVLATSMANSGGAWDNAKKYVETGKLGGKGSDVHIATVIGDTVGDPFKDTSGPSLNILIKLMAIISLVLVPLFL